MKILIRFGFVVLVIIGILEIAKLTNKVTAVQHNTEVTLYLNNFSGTTQVSVINYALDTAERGDNIRIVLDRNPGGYVWIYSYLREHINNTQAIVTIEARGFTASAAANILNAGDYLIMPYDNIILFHQAFITIPFIGKFHTENTIKLSLLLAIEADMWRFLDVQQTADYLDKKDVTLSGLEYCQRANNVRMYDDHCVIKE